MTRRAALTVRLPGASTMPVTSTSTCSQTEVVKKLWKGAISEMTIGGRIGAAADEEEERCRVIAKVESSRRELSSILFAIRPRHFESALFEARQGQPRADTAQWRHD